MLVTTDHGSIHCHRPATVFAKRDATQNLRYKFGDDLRAEDPSLVFSVSDERVLRFPPGRRGHQLPDRPRGRLLRLSDQAPPVPGALPRELPARGGQPGGDDPPRRPPDAAMKLYLRILGYLQPPRAGCSRSPSWRWSLYAALDAFSFTLLIPFLEVLFKGGRAAGRRGDSSPAAASALHRLLDWAVGDLVARRRAHGWRCATWCSSSSASSS